MRTAPICCSTGASSRSGRSPRWRRRPATWRTFSRALAKGGEDRPPASPATIHRKSACLRSFYRHLRRDGLLDTDPTASLSTPRRARKLPQVLTRGEVEKLLAQPQGTEPAALRDRALLEVMYACGLRASEAIGLELMDVDIEEGVLRARGKGSKERVVPIGQAALKALRVYVRARPAGAREGRARGAPVRELPRRPPHPPGPLQDRAPARADRRASRTG